jgi:hypothetical protein
VPGTTRGFVKISFNILTGQVFVVLFYLLMAL